MESLESIKSQVWCVAFTRYLSVVVIFSVLMAMLILNEDCVSHLDLIFSYICSKTCISKKRKDGLSEPTFLLFVLQGRNMITYALSKTLPHCASCWLTEFRWSLSHTKNTPPYRSFERPCLWCFPSMQIVLLFMVQIWSSLSLIWMSSPRLR